MLRSMFSAISGLRSHQLYLDIVGNNIANVNTTGFKANRATFAETLWQTSRGGTAPDDNSGGLNPLQVGLGVTLSGADANFTQGDLRSTGKLSDLTIVGNGFFILSDGERQVYSRDGAMDAGIDGLLQHTTTGLRVLGWMVDQTTGEVNTMQSPTPISIPLGEQTLARATGSVAFSGNLDARAPVNPDLITPPVEGSYFTSTVDVYDSLGGLHAVTITFSRVAHPTDPMAPPIWHWEALADPDDTLIEGNTPPTVAVLGSGDLSFETDGSLAGAATANINIDFTGPSGLADQSITLDFSRITQVADRGQVSPFSRDGEPAGTFTGFSTDNNGVIWASYSNGAVKAVAQLALADFKNVAGLLRAGNNLYEASPNSGDPMIAPAGTNGIGETSAGFLEMSNVDLGQQFTNMIIASRGFQANSRIISVADEMLQELVNLRR